MRLQKLLDRFHKGQTLFFIDEKLKDHYPFTTKISLWKTGSNNTKVMVEEFFDKYIEANDLYEKDETTEYSTVDLALKYLSEQYNIKLEQFK